MKKSFKVTLDIPEGVNIMEMRQYIIDSLKDSYIVGYVPRTSIKNLNSNSIKCIPIKEEF